MPDIRIASSEGGAFDCHIAPPKSGTGPALIVMSSIFGVDADVRGIAADLAGRGIFVAAPDLFWRGDSGPKDRSEEGVRTANARAADRVPMIEGGLRDLVDVMTALRAMPECNGRFASVGLCFGGPFALLGPARAGCDAGFAFHGTAVQEYLDLVPEIGNAPIRLHWGDLDHACPPEDLARVRAATAAKPNVEITIYPGVRHGYTAPSNEKNWNEAAATDSWASAMKVLETLR